MLLNNVNLIDAAIPLQSLCQLMLLITQHNTGLKCQFQQIFQQIPLFSEEIIAQAFLNLNKNI